MGKFKLELIKHNYGDEKWWSSSLSYRVSLIIILHRNKQSRWRSSRQYTCKMWELWRLAQPAMPARDFSFVCASFFGPCCCVYRKYNLACVTLCWCLMHKGSTKMMRRKMDK
jgi:hypothetical protein